MGVGLVMVKIFGFSLLRDGVKYDYSFAESLNSLKPLCEKVYLALGEGEDSTRDEVQKLPHVHVIPTVWDPELRKGGLILSQQTNVALDTLRADVDEASAWGVYLQADEVLHEREIEKICADIQKAEEQGCDAVRFRYYHFWQSHHQIAINKKWYPQEIRAVKLKSNIESWGDAQSFRNFNKVYESDASIYHYGHVREEESYEKKKAGFFRMYVGDSELNKYVSKMEKKDAHTETLNFWGAHPQIMKSRIERLGEKFSATEIEKLGIIGDKSNYSSELVSRIRAKEIIWGQSQRELKSQGCDVIVKTKSSFFGKKFPNQMRSKLAREWPLDIQFTLQLSEKGVGFN